MCGFNLLEHILLQTLKLKVMRYLFTFKQGTQTEKKKKNYRIKFIFQYILLIFTVTRSRYLMVFFKLKF